MFETFILAIVQSVAEFLPISSSGHLILVPAFLHWQDQGLVADIALHVGTLFSVLLYFRTDLIVMIHGAIDFKHKNYSSYRINMALKIVIATLPIVVVGALLHSYISDNLRSPKIIATSSDLSHYIQTDLGDNSLYKTIQDSLKNGELNGQSINYLKQSLNYLVDLQIKGHKGLDYSKAYPTPAFDKTSVLEDLNYFKYYFLKLHESVIYNSKRLDEDFNRLADYIVQAPSDFFMYRDFQSRNIMIKNEQPYFIDFQGGRRGPLQYDVVSLLYQVKSNIPQDIKQQLIDYYKDTLSKYINPDEIQFDRYFPAFVLVRLLQVAGAYGFRGLIQKKSHFIESISLSLQSLKSEYKKVEIELPELNSALEQLFKLSNRYSTINSDRLKVTIYSFSYKNGSYPPDYSGNGGGHVFDCRSLPNPGREQRFKSLNGKDQAVADYLEQYESVKQFIEYTQAIVSQSVENYIKRGFNNLSISFGCTGGQHRSVYFAQKTYEWLKLKYNNIDLEINHLIQHISQSYKA